MSRHFFISFLLLLCIYCCNAKDTNSALWQKGNNFYKQKQYDSAAACFELIASQKPVNAQLYYNLGNTYYRLNMIPQAVLNYQKALWLQPGFKDAKENLLLTQSRISNPIPEAGEIFFIRWWQWVTRPDFAMIWAVIGALVFILIISLLLYREFKKTETGYPIPIQAPVFLVFVLIGVLTLAYFSSANSNSSDLAVVMQKDTPLMNPSLKGKPICLIPEGTTVHITMPNADWVEVKLPDGRSGWLQLSLVQQISK